MPLDQLHLEMTDTESAPKEPQPGQKRTRRGRRSKASIEGQLRDELEMVLQFTAAMWSVKDPVCAPVLSQQSHDIAVEVAKLAGKSEWARKYLSQVVEIGSIIPLCASLLPVIKTISDHHIMPKVQQRREQEEQPEQTTNDGMAYAYGRADSMG